MGGCVTQVSIMQDVWDSLGLQLNPKDLKSGNKRLSFGQFTNGRLRDSSEYHARSKRCIRVFLCFKKILNRARYGWVMAILPIVGCLTPVSVMLDVWDPLEHHLNQKYLKSGKTWLSYGQFNNQRLGTQISIMPDVRDPSGLHLNHDDLKLSKNWLSSAQFTKGRLRDSSE